MTGVEHPRTGSQTTRLTDPARSFGVREFQLVLLRRMADHQPGLVEDAVDRLGATATDLRAANRHWQALARSPRRPSDLTRLRAALGEPCDRRRRLVGDLPVELVHWTLPLWPDLRFEAVAVESGHVWEQHLVRPDPATAPRLVTVDDLVPWSCLIGDVDRAFPGGTPLEGDAPSRWGLQVTVPAADGGRVRLTARFVYGLLQQVVTPGRGA